MSIISIIIPIYNTEVYLNECINSVLNQSYKEYELILIDDGSSDKSIEICNEYVKRNPNKIKFFHQENKGVTAARRLGVYYAKGDYICFVDSDDRISYNALEILMNFVNDDVDIVISNTNFDEIITGSDYVNRLLCGKMPVALWGKLFKKTLLMNSGALDLDRHINVGEDWYANLRVALHVKKVVCLSSSVYLYCNNPTSVMHIHKDSLLYEETFRTAMEYALGKEKSKYKESWYKFQLHLLEKLIIQKITFSYDRPWIQNLFHESSGYSFSIREKLTYYVRNATLCRFSLMLVAYVRHYLRHFYRYRNG